MPGMFDPYFYNRMRNAYPRNDHMQGVLGPLEHRDFVRETVGHSPVMGASLAVATPAYTLAKLLGFFPRARSKPSWDEVFAAYEGLFSGLADRVKK